jgi:hypothetical protein
MTLDDYVLIKRDPLIESGLFIVLKPMFASEEVAYMVKPGTRIEFNRIGNVVKFTDNNGKEHRRAVTSIVAIGVGGGSAINGR